MIDREKVTALEGEFAEPIQEHSQFAHIIKQVLRFRHLKHAQVEMIETSLENKAETLETLQEMENEARRLEEAISRERTIGSNAVDIDELNGVHENENGSTTTTIMNGSSPSSSIVLTRRRSARTWGSSPMRVINAVGHSLQGIIDVDPEATRRNQIGRTKDAMTVVSNDKRRSGKQVLMVNKTVARSTGSDAQRSGCSFYRAAGRTGPVSAGKDTRSA